MVVDVENKLWANLSDVLPWHKQQVRRFALSKKKKIETHFIE